MFFTTLSYLKFLLKSTNQHGVHSPFVFSLVTKGLYQKNTKTVSFDAYPQLQELTKKQKRILSKILIYFKIATIDFDAVPFSKKRNTYKLLYINKTKQLKKINTTGFNAKHIVLVDHLYQTKNSLEDWHQFISNTEGIVTVDLFYFGLIFFRTAQAKEHFRIRV